jgi:hypothetical protein
MKSAKQHQQERAAGAAVIDDIVRTLMVAGWVESREDAFQTAILLRGAGVDPVQARRLFYLAMTRVQ